MPRHPCGRHKVPRRKTKSLNGASVNLSRATLNPYMLAKPSRCWRHHRQIVWLAWLAHHQVCLFRCYIVADMAHQRFLRCKVEAAPVDVNNLFQAVAHLMLTCCLGRCCTWEGFKNNLECLRCWPPNGTKRLVLGLGIKPWDGVN